MVENEEKPKSLLMRVEEESEKAGLKLNIEKNKIMASSPIISQQINEEKVQTVTDFSFLASTITAHTKLKALAPWKKSYDKPGQRIKKWEHHFANRGVYSQSYSFPLVMYGCESWTIKKAELQRIEAFQLWCWKTLESPLDSKIKGVNAKGNKS